MHPLGLQKHVMDGMKDIGHFRRFAGEVRSQEKIAGEFFAVLAAAAKTGERVAVAVSGGTTPWPLYRAIAGKVRKSRAYAALAGRIDVFLLDERLVSLDHEESNGGRLRRLWGGLPFRCHLYKTDFPPDRAAQDYQTTLARHVSKKNQGVPVLDLVLLGLGEDGHTASLYPGTKALAETRKWVVVNNVPRLGVSRITMTFPVLKEARNRWVLSQGAGKIAAVGGILSRGKALWPIERLMTDGGSPLQWYMM